MEICIHTSNRTVDPSTAQASLCTVVEVMFKGGCDVGEGGHDAGSQWRGALVKMNSRDVSLGLERPWVRGASFKFLRRGSIIETNAFPAANIDE